MLVIAALAWVGLHIGVAGTKVRGAVVSYLGDRGFRGAFALASLALLVALIFAYRAAPANQLWVVPDWVLDVLAVAMLPAFILFVGAVSQANPTAIGGEAAGPSQATGIVRITRHPMLWSFAIWAAVHVIGNGDTASVIFFGAFLVTALTGMPSIDRKLARRDPRAWGALAAVTSIIPFGAIAQGRNRFAPAEYGWARFAAAIIAWGVLLYVHPMLFGVSPLG